MDYLTQFYKTKKAQTFIRQMQYSEYRQKIIWPKNGYNIKKYNFKTYGKYLQKSWKIEKIMIEMKEKKSIMYKLKQF
jgi:hypothetical protein